MHFQGENLKNAYLAKSSRSQWAKPPNPTPPPQICFFYNFFILFSTNPDLKPDLLGSPSPHKAKQAIIANLLIFVGLVSYWMQINLD